MCRVSVIIPVYNSEKFLCRCIESVISQTFTEWECILVDDGSTDSGGLICDEYAGNDERIKVIHQKNQGAMAARRVGVENAKGVWITFVDSDDEIYPYALEKLLLAAKENVDIVEGMVVGVSYIRSVEQELYGFEEYRQRCVEGSVFFTGSVAKLYRRSLFDSEVFNIPREITYGEDLIMRIRLAFNNRNDVPVVHTPVYRYFQHPASIVHRFSPTLEYYSFFFEFYEESIPMDYREMYSKQVASFCLGLLVRIISCSSHRIYLRWICSPLMKKMKGYFYKSQFRKKAYFLSKSYGYYIFKLSIMLHHYFERTRHFR